VTPSEDDIAVVLYTSGNRNLIFQKLNNLLMRSQLIFYSICLKNGKFPKMYKYFRF
jgi:hypothetical protein